MELLYLLQSIRTPLMDKIVALLTYLGDETVFMVLGMSLLWCVNKKWGFRFMATGLVGSALNQLLKAIFLVPRPWVLDPEFEIVEAAREAATGYSFPSGHTQTAATVYGLMAAWLKNTWARIACIAIILIVGFSRMYLGVHTPYDVSAALLLGALTVLMMSAFFKRAERDKRVEGVALLLPLAFSVLLLVYSLAAPVRAANIPEFDAHGVENAWKVLGASLGLFAAWQLDQKRTHYTTKAVWWAQILKVALGLGLVMAVRLSAKPLLALLLGGHASAGAIRYFLMCVIGGGLWPMTFSWFEKLGKA